MKFTAVACENIDLIKYWGYKNEDLLLPINSSVSVVVDGLLTAVTVEFSDSFSEDQVFVDGKVHPAKEREFLNHLERIRNLAGIKQKAMVAGQKNYQSNSLSLSDSFIAALTLAGSKAAGLELDEKGLAILAKQGKNNACRSITEGFSEWVDGNSQETSYTKTIFKKDFWDLAVVSVVVKDENQDYKPALGIEASNYYPTRLVGIPKKIKDLKKIINNRNFEEFGKLIEKESLDLLAIKTSSYPAFFDLEPEFITLIKIVSLWPNEGFKVYYTFNSEGIFHIFCSKENIQEVKNRLQALGYNNVFLSAVGEGVRPFEKDLF